MNDHLKKIEVSNMAIPCQECLESPDHTVSNGEFVAVYCRHRLAGAFLDTRPGAPLHGTWRIMSPIEETVFAIFVKTRVEQAAAKSAQVKRNAAAWN